MPTPSEAYRNLADKLSAVGQDYLDKNPLSGYSLVRMFQSKITRRVAHFLTDPDNDGWSAEARLVRAMKDLVSAGSTELRMSILQAVAEQRSIDAEVNNGPAVDSREMLDPYYPVPNPGFPEGSAIAIERMYDTTHGTQLTATNN